MKALPDSFSPALVPQVTLRSGAKMPVLGMGTFGSDGYGPDQVAAAVAGGLATGYRLFDCASVYGNEAQLGAVFSQALQDGQVTRDELFITSKVWNDWQGPGQVLESLERSLTDLRLSYVDAYFVHWPFPNYHAPGCDGDSRNPDSRPFSTEHYLSVWAQMEEAARRGWVRHLGMSNMTLPKLWAVLPHIGNPPELIEMEMHLSFQQTELFDFCRGQGIQTIAFCPLGSPSRPERDKAEGDLVDMDLPQVRQVAQAHGIHPALVCLKWAVQRGAAPIPFSVKPAQYQANLRCVTEDPLTEAEMDLLSTAEAGCRLVKGQVFLWPGASDWRVLWDEDGVIAR